MHDPDAEYPLGIFRDAFKSVLGLLLLSGVVSCLATTILEVFSSFLSCGRWLNDDLFLFFFTWIGHWLLSWLCFWGIPLFFLYWWLIHSMILHEKPVREFLSYIFLIQLTVSLGAGLMMHENEPWALLLVYSLTAAAVAKFAWNQHRLNRHR